MSKKFSKGDVVTLKSGGPRMTVEKYKTELGWDFNSESDDIVICTWFDRNDNLHSKEFDQETLLISEID